VIIIPPSLRLPASLLSDKNTEKKKGTSSFRNPSMRLVTSYWPIKNSSDNKKNMAFTI
jgi:hypothetical protein